MNTNKSVILCCLTAFVAAGAGAQAATGSAAGPGTVNERKLAQITPGKSTKEQVKALLGTPWRVVQFNDCGAAMPGQSDETWDYRGRDSGGTFRVHIEFDDGGIAHLVAKIPDNVTGDKGTTARTAPNESMVGMRM
ncbi:MAG: outer membrane protein assembly factor BamE [Steroidobacteraceae bacterium]|jgi:outer membrane protein assembly factor BamE (lipoprotein component of BamABCDE complex)